MVGGYVAISKKKMIKKTYLIASFDKLELDYICIPKAGSTTMLYALLKASGDTVRIPSGQAAWLHSEHLVNYITPEQADKNNHKRFTLIRHPVYRAYSMYYDFKKVRPGWGCGGSDRFAEDFKKVVSFKDFLELLLEYPNIERGSHFRTQTSHCILDNLSKFKLEGINNHDTKSIHPKLRLYERLNSNGPQFKISNKEEELVMEIYENDFTLWLEAL